MMPCTRNQSHALATIHAHTYMRGPAALYRPHLRGSAQSLAKALGDEAGLVLPLSYEPIARTEDSLVWQVGL